MGQGIWARSSAGSGRRCGHVLVDLARDLARVEVLDAVLGQPAEGLGQDRLLEQRTGRIGPLPVSKEERRGGSRPSGACSSRRVRAC